jgi:hypothetical protein
MIAGEPVKSAMANASRRRKQIFVISGSAYICRPKRPGVFILKR